MRPLQAAKWVEHEQDFFQSCFFEMSTGSSAPLAQSKVLY